MVAFIGLSGRSSVKFQTEISNFAFEVKSTFPFYELAKCHVNFYRYILTVLAKKKKNCVICHFCSEFWSPFKIKHDVYTRFLSLFPRPSRFVGTLKQHTIQGSVPGDEDLNVEHLQLLLLLFHNLSERGRRAVLTLVTQAITEVFKCSLTRLSYQGLDSRHSYHGSWLYQWSWTRSWSVLTLLSESLYPCLNQHISNIYKNTFSADAKFVNRLMVTNRRSVTKLYICTVLQVKLYLVSPHHSVTVELPIDTVIS